VRKQLDESFFGPRLVKPTIKADIPVIPPVTCQEVRKAYGQLLAGENIKYSLKLQMAHHCQKEDHEADSSANDAIAKAAIEQTITG